MKRNLVFLSLAFFLTITITSYSLSIDYPVVARKDDKLLAINKIEITDKYTIVSCEHVSPTFENGNPSWVNIDANIHLQDVYGIKKYPFVKAEGIPLSPQKYFYSTRGEKLAFKLYFEKLPDDLTFMDMIEKDGVGIRGSFNCYGVSLTNSFILQNINTDSNESSHSRSIKNPAVARKDDKLLSITQIEVTDEYTIVSFQHANPPFVGDGSPSVSLNKGMYLQDMYGRSTYQFVKAEGIPVSPNRHYFSKPGEVLDFKVYFEKLPPYISIVDIINLDGALFHFNCYGVSLTNSFGSVGRIGSFNQFSTLSDLPSKTIDTNNKISASSINQDRVREIAEYNKMLFDELMKAGFKREEALKIISSNH